jgi:hypothetical protein
LRVCARHSARNDWRTKPFCLLHASVSFALAALCSAFGPQSLARKAFCLALRVQSFSCKALLVACGCWQLRPQGSLGESQGHLSCARRNLACSPSFLGRAWGCPSCGGQRTSRWRPSPARHRLVGGLSCGSPLASQRRQSATRPRLAGCPSFGGQRQVLCRGKPQHSSPRSRLRRHRLAFGTASATLVRRSCSS